MEVSCPNCLAQLQAESENQKMECLACGNEFVPSEQALEDDFDLPPIEAVGRAPQSASSPSPHAESSPPPVQESLGLGGFEESEEAFEDIRNFGSNLLQPEAGDFHEESPESFQPPSEDHAPESEIPTQIGIVPPAASSSPKTAGEPSLLFTGSEVPGRSIAKILSPISVLSKSPQGDPLSLAYGALWEKAQGVGADAVVGVHWQASGDLHTVLISGIPVVLK